MPQPSTITYDVGSTIHGQPLRLIRSVQHGAVSWSLYKEPADQRDDQQAIHGIPRDVLLQIAEAAKQHAS